MSRGWQYKSGDWYVSCDVCSKQIYASEAKHRWDGMIVCEDDFETRHPQDLIKVRQERIGVPFTRLEPEDSFTVVNYVVALTCTPMTSLGEADRGTADCATVGNRLMNDLVD